MSNPHPSPGGRPLEQLKVTELRDELRKRGISSKGVKKELFERLDEAVRKEQADTFSSASEVGEGREIGIHGASQLEGEHGVPHSAGHPHPDHTSETVNDDDSLLYLNDGENNLQDSALIVDNASPFVGASDAIPVSMEPRTDVEQLNIGLDASEDDTSLIHSLNTSNTGALPESINETIRDAPMPDSEVLEHSPDISGAKNQGETLADIGQELGKQDRGSETILSAKDARDVDLSGDKDSSGGIDVASPKVDHEAGEKGDENEGLSVAPEAKDMSTTVMVGSMDVTELMNEPIVGDATNYEIIPSFAEESLGTEASTQGDAVIQFEAVKDDVAITSVSDDPLSVNNASLSSASCVANASNSSVQDGEVMEEAVLGIVNVAPCVPESVEDGSSGALKIGTPEELKDSFLVEEAKQVEVLDGSEVPLPLQAVVEAVELIPTVANLQAVQDSALPEVGQVTAIAEPLQDAIMHEEVQDLGGQRMQPDIDMSEAPNSQSVKIEASETVLDTRIPSNAADLHIDVKSENVVGVHTADLNLSKRASRDTRVEEGKPNIKLEPMEAESRAGRRTMPVESVKVEQQDIKEHIPKSGKVFDRSKPRDSEYERSRHEPVRAVPYGNEMNRAEERSRRVFREERRKDPPKERDSKVHEEEFHDRTSQKRKDDGWDANLKEPVKRVRRWNSGNELVVETAKPLTTGIVKEITSPEVKKKGFAIAPTKLTPEVVGPSRSMSANVKTNSEANGDKKPVPPSAMSPTSSLKVERFVRPFTLKAVKDLLAEFGQCVDFWMDQIKTHCYVRYSKVDEAVAARNGLYNKQWPLSFGNLLVAEFVDPNEVKIRSDGSFEKMNAPPLAAPPQGNPNQPLAAQLPGAFHGHSNSLPATASLRERQLMRPPMKDPEPLVPTVDDLFRKTKAKPHIYYLPLTDEQVAEKLSAAAKSKEQQNGRGKVLGRV